MDEPLQFHSLATVLKSLSERQQNSGPAALPRDSTCSECHLLRLDLPAVQEALIAKGMLNAFRGCQCVPPEVEAERRSHRWLRFANLDTPKPRTFATFQDRIGNESALPAARQFARGQGPPHILNLSGMTGTGKTHLLEAIGRDCLSRGIRVYYDTSARMLRTLREGYEQETYHQLMAMLEAMPVLLIDDIGAEKPTDWAIETLTSIVDHRWRTGGRLAVGTNKTQKELGDQNFRLASRLFDTETGSVQIVYLECSDYRTGETW